MSLTRICEINLQENVPISSRLLIFSGVTKKSAVEWTRETKCVASWIVWRKMCKHFSAQYQQTRTDGNIFPIFASATYSWVFHHLTCGNSYREYAFEVIASQLIVPTRTAPGRTSTLERNLLKLFIILSDHPPFMLALVLFAVTAERKYI